MIGKTERLKLIHGQLYLIQNAKRNSLRLEIGDTGLKTHPAVFDRSYHWILFFIMSIFP
jgi:hypothetical protein